jgi:hypothetical protein
MRRLKPGTVGLAVALLLIVPHAASAGMGDFIDTIIGLTGPQMVGVPMACEVILEGDDRDTACYIAGIGVPWPRPLEDDRFWRRRDSWVSFGGGVYTSTGKDSEMRGFEAYDVWMLALEPMWNIRSIGRLPGRNDPRAREEAINSTSRKFTMEHGVGPSLLFFFGDGINGNDFDAFANGAIKVRPVALTWRNLTQGGFGLGVAYNLRIFPKAFTAEDFGGDPATNEHEGREYAHGFSVSLSF